MYDIERLIDALISCVSDNERLSLMASALYYDIDALKIDICALVDFIEQKNNNRKDV